MTATVRLALACMLALQAAGCKDRDADQGGNQVSKVLPGSVSDAMIPYDTLRSQPPLASATEESDGPRDRPARPADAGAASDAPVQTSVAAAEPSGRPADTPPPAPSGQPPEVQ